MALSTDAGSQIEQAVSANAMDDNSLPSDPATANASAGDDDGKDAQLPDCQCLRSVGSDSLLA